MPNSYAPEVIADSSGKWCGNALRFATREEAEQNVASLAWSWTSVRDTRVVESDDAPNYRWLNGEPQAIEPPRPAESFPDYRTQPAGTVETSPTLARELGFPRNGTEL